MTPYQRESDLIRQIGEARAEYDAAALASASGDESANLADIRERITELEGQLADARAAIAGGERIQNDNATAAARKQRLQLLNAVVRAINRRNELAPVLVEQIAQIGETYRSFIKADQEARENAARADSSRRTFEGVDVALGVQNGIDQQLAGLFHSAGLKCVMKESGAVWAKTAQGGLSFVDIQVQRTGRALTAVNHQIGQERSDGPSTLSRRDAP